MFGRFFLGRTASSIGVWIHNFVAVLLAYELTRSAFVVGLVSVAQFLPQLVLAPLSGAAADRGDRRRQAIVGRYLVAGGAGGMALWLVGTDLTAGADTAALLTSALVVGLGFVVGGPALHALVPALVREGEIVTAVTLDMVPATLARALGPVIGAAAALALGPEVAFGIAAVSNLAFALALHTLSAAPGQPKEGRSTGDTGVWGGFAYLRSDRASRRLLIGITAVGFGADPAMTLAPSIATGIGQPATFAGGVASAFGIGAGVAFVVIPVARRFIGIASYGTLGLALMCVSAAGLVPAATPATVLSAFAAGGVGMTLAVTSLSAQLQERVPDELRGRIMALWSMAFLGSRPLAAAMNGAVADHVSVPAALVLVAVLMAFAVLVSRAPARG